MVFRHTSPSNPDAGHRHPRTLGISALAEDTPWELCLALGDRTLNGLSTWREHAAAKALTCTKEIELGHRKSPPVIHGPLPHPLRSSAGRSVLHEAHETPFYLLLRAPLGTDGQLEFVCRGECSYVELFCAGVVLRPRLASRYARFLSCSESAALPRENTATAYTFLRLIGHTVASLYDPSSIRAWRRQGVTLVTAV